MVVRALWLSRASARACEFGPILHARALTQMSAIYQGFSGESSQESEKKGEKQVPVEAMMRPL